MLAAVICFVSVLCTASLASFGMDAATIALTRGSSSPDSSQHGSSVESAADEDIVRISDDRCLLFHAFFASAAILVAVLYYAIVKFTLMAMGAVIMAPPKPHPLYGNEDSDVSSSSYKSDCGSSTDGKLSPGGRNSEDDDGNNSSSTLSLSTSNGSKEEDEDFGPYQVRSCGGDDESDQDDISSATEMREIVTRGAAALEKSNSQDDDERPLGNRSSSSNTIVIIHQSESQVEGSREGRHKVAERHVLRLPSTIPRSDRNMGLFEIEEEVVNAPATGTPKASKRCGGATQNKSKSVVVALPPPHPGSERFNALKIWTNIYGLSVGIYCLVYSLLLPNELSAFVFSVAALVAGVHDVIIPCIHDYLREEQYEILDDTNGRGRRKKAKRWARSGGTLASQQVKPSFRRQFKRCLGWLCLFQSSITSEISEAATESIRGSRLAHRAKSKKREKQLRGAQSNSTGGGFCCRCFCCFSSLGHCCKDTCLDILDCVLCCTPRRWGCYRTSKMLSESRHSSSSFLRSGVLAMPCIILLIAAGLACKALQDVRYKDAMVHELLYSIETSTGGVQKHQQHQGASAAAPWDNNNVSDDAGFNQTSIRRQLPANNTQSNADGDIAFPGYGFTDAGGVFVNILFPIIGVLMIKSMRKTKNVRETIELAVPVSALNSMCVACIIVLQAPACLLKHFSSTIVMGLVSPHHSGGDRLESSDNPMVLVRYQPILAALALPFPLVCAIVCIVAAGRNHRFMVGVLIACVCL